MNSQTLTAGFSDPVVEAQDVFRTVLEVLSRPGRIATLDPLEHVPDTLMPATAAIALTLFDSFTPVYLDPDLRTADAQTYLKFQTGCPLTEDPGKAAFAIVSVEQMDKTFKAFSIGQPEYPDRSTTLIVQAPDIQADEGVRLSGPGIKDSCLMAVGGMSAGNWKAIQLNNALFPLGMDFIFAAGSKVSGLPRSTKVEI